MTILAAGCAAIGQIYTLPLIILLVLCIRWVKQSISLRYQYRFPNPVPGLPIIGNSLQMPTTGQGPYLQALGEKYGDM